jgi:PhzF family phenazine biosynthesis protein
VRRPFQQVDVFGARRCAGNPVAVVLDGTGLTDGQMQSFAAWTNLSETTFVLPAEAPTADYRLRIFTPTGELPFAGHPTLGSCHAVLTARGEGSGAAPGARPGARPGDGRIVQECGAGLVELRRTAGGLAFAAPRLLRSGPVDEPLLGRVADQLGLRRAEIRDAAWVDNGPGWIGVLLDSADAVLALRPGPVQLPVGVVGAYPAGAECAVEVRAFFPGLGGTAEDPVTGSLNASLAQWLVPSGRFRLPYVASQGGALGRHGRVHVSGDPDGGVWVGGATVTCIAGEVDLG